MAKKIRLGFEFIPPYAAIDGKFCSCDGNNHFNYIRYVPSSENITHRNKVSELPWLSKPYRYSMTSSFGITSTASARTTGSDGKGGISYMYNNQYGSLALKLDNINEGIFLNYWQNMTPIHTRSDGSSYGGAVLFSAFNGVDKSANTADNLVHVYIAPDAAEYVSQSEYANKRLYIYSNGSILAESELLTIPYGEFINVKMSLDNAGIITGEVNGKSVSYDLKNLSWVTDGSFDTWEAMNVIGTSRGDTVDDVAINDGTGSEDNGMPGDVRCYAAEKTMQYAPAESSGVVNNFNSGDNPLDEVGVLTDSQSTTFLEFNKSGNSKFSIKAEDFLPEGGHGMIEPKVTDLFCILSDVRASTADQILTTELKESNTNTLVSTDHYLSLTADYYVSASTSLDLGLSDLSAELATINLRYT